MHLVWTYVIYFAVNWSEYKVLFKEQILLKYMYVMHLFGPRTCMC